MGVVAEQYPYEKAVFKRLRLTFAEAIKILQENGFPDVSMRFPPSAHYPLEQLSLKKLHTRTHTHTHAHTHTLTLTQIDPMDDLSTELERNLGKLVKQKYDTDFYIVHK